VTFFKKKQEVKLPTFQFFFIKWEIAYFNIPSTSFWS
jgi:hypothetical protein